jgi:methyl-accepting chemotaxis protein
LTRLETGAEERTKAETNWRGRALAAVQWAKGIPARLRRGKRRRQLDLPAADQLVALSAALERIMDGAEPQFLELGGRLQSLYADADDLVDQTRRAAAAVGEGGEGGLLAHLDGMAHDALADLKARREAIAGRLRDLTGSAEQLLRLSEICGGLGKTGLSLNVVGLNIAVESSRSAASGEMFAVFTDEIRGLSRRISQISESIRDAGVQNRRDQLAAHQKIRGGLDSLSRLIGEAEFIVGGSLERIHELMDFSREALERSTESSREISRLVGEVVVAIQFHDISRQKAEHVSAAIADAVSLLRAPTEPLPVVRGRVHRLLTLQGGQLREMVDEIYAARRQAAHAFQNLTSVVEGLVADADLLEAGEKAEDRLTHHRRGLEKGLRQLRDLLRRGRDMDEEIRRIAEDGAEAASGLSEHIDRVRGISFDLHLKALNAVVKSARLQREGLALEVLAQEVSKLSTQSGGFVDDVVEILEALVSLSLDLDLMEDGDDETAADRNIADGLTEMAERFDQFQADAARAPERSRALQAKIQAAGETLGFLDSLGNEMSMQIEELAVLVDRFAPWSAAAWQGSAETLEQAAHRYTMESERRLHSRYFDKATVATWTAAPESGGVELFDDETPAGAEFPERPQLPPAEAGSPGAVPAGEAADDPDESDDPDEILWPAPEEDERSGGESETSAGEPEDDDLGDNVELF